jgi:hypothetical protein
MNPKDFAHLTQDLRTAKYFDKPAPPIAICPVTGVRRAARLDEK